MEDHLIIRRKAQNIAGRLAIDMIGIDAFLGTMGGDANFLFRQGELGFDLRD